MITYYKCKNMAGIFAGTGRLEIELDFTKSESNNKIIALLGQNASGKSTLLSLLHPLRGTNDNRSRNFVLPNKEGYEEIHIRIEGHKYIIKHYYGDTSSKNKSFITKDGIEMNENGGIKTFNSYLKEELNLDESYFVISRMGSNVDGFIKKPAGGRKDYINEFVPNIDDYLEAYRNANEKYKKFNKEANSYKESLAGLNKEELEASKSTLELEENRIEYERQQDMIQLSKYKDDLAKIEKELQGVDPDISEKIVLIDNEKIEKDSLYEAYCDKFSNLSKYSVEELNMKISESKNKIENNTNLLKLNNESLNELEEEKQKKEFKMESIESVIELIRKDIKDDSINKVQLANDIINKNETIEQFNDLINNYLTYYNYDNLKLTFYRKPLEDILEGFKILRDTYESNSEIYEDLDISSNCIHRIQNEFNEIDIEMEKTKKEITILNSEVNYLEKEYPKHKKAYSKIPEDCHSSITCPFVKNSIEFIQKEYPKKDDKISLIDKYNERLDKLYIDKENVQSKIKFVDNMLSLYEKFNNHIYFFNLIMENNNIGRFEDFIMYKGLTDICDNILNKIEEAIGYEREISELEIKIENNKRVIEENKEKQKALEKEENDLYEINEEVIKLSVKKDKLNIEKEQLEKAIKISNNTITVVTKFRDNLVSKLEIDKEYERLHIMYEQNESNIQRKEATLYNIEEIENKPLNERLSEVKSKLDNIKNNLFLFKTYSDKLNEIESKIVDIYEIKEALDPKKGIPLLFMEDYLYKVEDKTNELLDKAYNGSFQIKFSIKKREFLIQVFKSDGTNLNDILMASQGQIALTTIALSLAMIETLLENCKFKAIYVDEADSSLDPSNRRIFLDMVQIQLGKEIDQCFMITHNDEFYSQPIDMILLKDNGIDKSDKDFMENKNIIFDIDN